jgi:hypothetical protein
MKTSSVVFFFLLLGISFCLKLKLNEACPRPAGQTVLKFTGGNKNGTALNKKCLSSTNADFAQRDNIPQYDESCDNTKSTWGPNPAVSNFVKPKIPASCDRTLWAQQRILHVIDNWSSRGYNYCHHHAGTWVPPQNKHQRAVINVCSGGGDPTASHGTCSSARPGVWTGIDCTHYTSWAYLYGFGMYLVTNVNQQACGPHSPGKALPYTRDQQDQLLPGDLLYLYNGPKTKYSHGFLWTGIKADLVNKDSVPYGINTLLNNLPVCQRPNVVKQIAANPEKPVYVISDSHWNGPGYRPFAGWYYNAFSHAKRLINPDPSLPQNPEPLPEICSKK